MRAGKLLSGFFELTEPPKPFCTVESRRTGGQPRETGFRFRTFPVSQERTASAHFPGAVSFALLDNDKRKSNEEITSSHLSISAWVRASSSSRLPNSCL